MKPIVSRLARSIKLDACGPATQMPGMGADDGHLLRLGTVGTRIGQPGRPGLGCPSERTHPRDEEARPPGPAIWSAVSSPPTRRRFAWKTAPPCGQDVCGSAGPNWGERWKRRLHRRSSRDPLVAMVESTPDGDGDDLRGPGGRYAAKPDDALPPPPSPTSSAPRPRPRGVKLFRQPESPPRRNCAKYRHSQMGSSERSAPGCPCWMPLIPLSRRLFSRHCSSPSVTARSPAPDRVPARGPPEAG